MSAALVDAGPMIAAFNPADPKAPRYRELFKKAATEHWVLSTTWPCVVEASYLIQPPQRYSFLKWIARQAVSVFPFEQQVLEEFADLMHRYTQTPRTQMDLADASLLWLAESTGVTRVMTMDVRDFSRYRLADGRAFEVL